LSAPILGGGPGVFAQATRLIEAALAVLVGTAATPKYPNLSLAVLPAFLIPVLELSVTFPVLLIQLRLKPSIAQQKLTRTDRFVEGWFRQSYARHRFAGLPAARNFKTD
jgi:hypothetical protein